MLAWQHFNQTIACRVLAAWHLLDPLDLSRLSSVNTSAVFCMGLDALHLVLTCVHGLGMGLAVVHALVVIDCGSLGGVAGSRGSGVGCGHSCTFGH